MSGLLGTQTANARAIWAIRAGGVTARPQRPRPASPPNTRHLRPSGARLQTQRVAILNAPVLIAVGVGAVAKPPLGRVSVF